MSVNSVDLVRDYDVETSYGLFPNCLHPFFSSDHVGPEVIIISNNSGSEGMSETSMEVETSSSESLDALI